MICLIIIIVDRPQVYLLYSWRMGLVLKKQGQISKLVARIDSQRIVPKWIKRHRHKLEPEVSLLNIAPRIHHIIVNIIRPFLIIRKKK